MFFDGVVLGFVCFEEVLLMFFKGDGLEFVFEDIGERCEWREGFIGGFEVLLIFKRFFFFVRDCGDRERLDIWWFERVIWWDEGLLWRCWRNVVEEGGIWGLELGWGDIGVWDIVYKREKMMNKWIVIDDVEDVW